MVHYINPDGLLCRSPATMAITVTLGLELELSSDKCKHVLPPTEESLPGLVIDGRLIGVETLEMCLLSSMAGTSVRLDEARVAEEDQRLEEARILITLLGHAIRAIIAIAGIKLG